MVVLVGYATAHGSTHEVAERLAADLGRAGLKADVRPLEAVEDADTYGAFVLGSAVHNQNWLDPARRFVRDSPGRPEGRTEGTASEPPGSCAGRVATADRTEGGWMKESRRPMCPDSGRDHREGQGPGAGRGDQRMGESP
jgi:hypothetical protein